MQNTEVDLMALASELNANAKHEKNFSSTGFN